MDMRGFLVLVSLLYVGIVRFVIRLNYITVAVGSLSSPVGRYLLTRIDNLPAATAHTNTRHNITQSSAPDDGHTVARNILSNYLKRNKEYKK